MNNKMKLEIAVTESPSTKTLMKLLNISPVVSLNYCNPEGKDLDVFVREGRPDDYSLDIVKYEFRHNIDKVEKKVYIGTVSDIVDGQVVSKDLWSHVNT